MLLFRTLAIISASGVAIAFALALAVAPVQAQTEAHSELHSTYIDRAGAILGHALTSDTAYETLGELCDQFGHRLSGTPELEDAIDWCAERMREFGLQNVHKEKVLVPTWVRGEESASIVVPRHHELTILGLGRSVGTPTNGIEAPVVVVDSYEELEAIGETAVLGKIVLYDVPFTSYGETVAYRSRGASEAAKLGAVAVLVRSVGPKGHDTPHTGALRYAEDVPQIPAAAVTVEDAERLHRMVDRGTEVVVRLLMDAQTLDDSVSYNLVGEVVGSELPDEIVVVGGHIDSWDVGQGAQDDGAGCIISLDAARIIQHLGLAPRRTLRVVLFTNEENGLRGGEAYLAAHEDELDNHVALIESDTGNGLASGFRLDVREAAVPEDAEDPEAALEELKQVALANLNQLASLLAPLGANQNILAYGGADISPMVKLGAVGLGMHHDTTGYWPIHHTPADTFDRIVKDDLDRNVAIMAIAAYVLADMPGRLIPRAR